MSPEAMFASLIGAGKQDAPEEVSPGVEVIRGYRSPQLAAEATGTTRTYRRPARPQAKPKENNSALPYNPTHSETALENQLLRQEPAQNAYRIRRADRVMQLATETPAQMLAEERASLNQVYENLKDAAKDVKIAQRQIDFWIAARRYDRSLQNGSSTEAEKKEYASALLKAAEYLYRIDESSRKKHSGFFKGDMRLRRKELEGQIFDISAILSAPINGQLGYATKKISKEMKKYNAVLNKVAGNNRSCYVEIKKEVSAGLRKIRAATTDHNLAYEFARSKIIYHEANGSTPPAAPETTITAIAALVAQKAEPAQICTAEGNAALAQVILASTRASRVAITTVDPLATAPQANGPASKKGPKKVSIDSEGTVTML